MTTPGNSGGRGGYQAPAKPAPVSGPGKYSRRTDVAPHIQLSDAAYGEQATFQGAQGAAPLGQNAAQPNPSAGMSGPGFGLTPLDLSGAVPLSAPTQSPGEPVTSGAAVGPGVGTQAIQRSASNAQDVQRLRELLPALEIMASMPSASPMFRDYVRRVRGSS